MEGYRRLPCRTVFNLGVEMPDLYLMLVECQARSTDQALQNEARINLEEFRRHRMSQEAAVIPADITSQEKINPLCRGRTVTGIYDDRNTLV